MSITQSELNEIKKSILSEISAYMNTTGLVTQYIGARYVPLFADPLEWDDDREYEPLTVVLHEGNSYTSRQHVPKGIDISDTDFWAQTGNYDAQVEQYRQEVARLRVSVEANTEAIASEVERAKAAEKANADAIQEEIERATEAEKNIFNQYIPVFGDSWSDTGYHEYNWPSKLNGVLGIKIKNYAKASASFSNVSTRPQIITQVNAAKIDDSYDHNAVKNVVMMGGINDWDSKIDFNTFYSNLKSTVEAAKNVFPNAKITVLTNNAYPLSNDYMRHCVTSVNKLTQDLAYVSAHSMFGWIFPDESYWEADGYHPTDSGSTILASDVLKVITGGEVNLFSTSSQFYNSDVTIARKTKANFASTTSTISVEIKKSGFNQNTATIHIEPTPIGFEFVPSQTFFASSNTGKVGTIQFTNIVYSEQTNRCVKSFDIIVKCGENITDSDIFVGTAETSWLDFGATEITAVVS